MTGGASNRILAIVRKEWWEVVGRRAMLLSLILAPLLISLVAVGDLAVTVAAIRGGGPDDDPIPEMMLANCGAAQGSDCIVVFVARTFQTVFLLLPIVLPSAMVAHGIVGEKNARTLEPLLATPITTWELLLGKTIAAIVPGLVATWAACGIFAVGLVAIGVREVAVSVLTPQWFVTIGTLSPLLAFLSVQFGMLVSSRTTDPRIAQQLAGLIVLPFMGLFATQLLGVVAVSVGLVLGTAVVLVVLGMLAFWLAVYVFDRETILTRWQ